MQRELLISIIVFVISCLGSLSSYYLIVKRDVVDNSIVKNVEAGLHTYDILDNGKCVGKAQYELLTKGDISEIKSKGQINVKYITQHLPVVYAFEASFNSIGQLGGAVLKIDVLDQYIIVGSTSIDPIKISVRSNLLGAEKELGWSIAGPIEIKKQGSTYNIIGLSFGRIKKENANLFAQNPLGQIPVKIESSGANACDNLQGNALDITPYLETVKKLYAGYARL